MVRLFALNVLGGGKMNNERIIEFECLICHQTELRRVLINRDTNKLFGVCEFCKEKLMEEGRW